MSDLIKAVELKVAAYSDLSAEEARNLYAAYVSRWTEVENARSQLAEVRAKLDCALEALDCISKYADPFATATIALNKIHGGPGRPSRPPDTDIPSAIGALKRILKKVPHKVGVYEAADMAVEFQLEAKVALAALTEKECAGPFVDAKDCPVHDPRQTAKEWDVCRCGARFHLKDSPSGVCPDCRDQTAKDDKV